MKLLFYHQKNPDSMRVQIYMHPFPYPGKTTESILEACICILETDGHIMMQCHLILQVLTLNVVLSKKKSCCLVNLDGNRQRGKIFHANLQD